MILITEMIAEIIAVTIVAIRLLLSIFFYSFPFDLSQSLAISHAAPLPVSGLLANNSHLFNIVGGF